MKSMDEKWRRLVAAARRAPRDDEFFLPPGFATRVAARACAGPVLRVSWVERLSLRAVIVSGLLALASAGVNYSLQAHSASANQPAEQGYFVVDDPAAIVLNAVGQ